MILSTPTECRIAASAGRMKLDPTWHWRAQYSLGRMESCETTDCPHSISWEPVALPILRVEEIEGPECLGDPGRALLGEDELELGMAFQDAGEDEVPKRAMCPPGDLEHEHDLFDVLVAQRRYCAPAVVVDREARDLAGPPERVVDPRVQRARDPNPGERRAGGCQLSFRLLPPTRLRRPRPARRAA